MIETQRLRTIRKYKTFDLVEEIWSLGPDDPSPTKIAVYVNKNGSIIDCRYRKNRRPGLIKLIAKLGISPIPARSKHGGCSIGKSAVNGKWYGWSHRAIVGFGKGDRIFEERYGTDGTPFVEHGRKTIRTDKDARLAATRFARHVS